MRFIVRTEKDGNFSFPLLSSSSSRQMFVSKKHLHLFVSSQRWFLLKAASFKNLESHWLMLKCNFSLSCLLNLKCYFNRFDTNIDLYIEANTSVANEDKLQWKYPDLAIAPCFDLFKYSYIISMQWTNCQILLERISRAFSASTKTWIKVTSTSGVAA